MFYGGLGPKSPKSVFYEILATKQNQPRRQVTRAVFRVSRLTTWNPQNLPYTSEMTLTTKNYQSTELSVCACELTAGDGEFSPLNSPAFYILARKG